mmetsp:Transcript_9621/g.17873  ORF Transcript_9621/g.17873 Transcript_9621/m.17873 type:complete len:161 (+) Transcript_9621:115-597(+)
MRSSRQSAHADFLFGLNDDPQAIETAFLPKVTKARASSYVAADGAPEYAHPDDGDKLPLKWSFLHPEHSLRLEESSLGDLTASLKYMSGAAMTGGAASMANVVFGVSIIGLLAYHATRSTVAKCLPPRKLELVPSPLLPDRPPESEGEEQAEADAGDATA